MFWEEFDYFTSKTGVFANCKHIWNSTNIVKGNAHLWHCRNSYRYTEVLGKLACWVRSKILGIGSAERSWGDVKHLKTNNCSHLSGDRVKKQATIFGSYCMERANIKMVYKENQKNPYKYWTNEDFDKEFDMFTDHTSNKEKKRIRLFRNWKEDWEDDYIIKKSPVSEAKLLEKYGGLQWMDIDNDQLVYSNPTDLKWEKRRGRGGFYCLIAYDEHYDKDAEDKDDHIEPWEFSDDLRGSISEYYNKNKELSVNVIELESNDSEEVQSEENNTASARMLEDDEDDFR